ncbi:hypothetical protein BGZ61DRAFT_440936 [Ilyonectria robusta]|uniref:uncharacterized protein n=1 Tax=Ilyonectria robusta TaxID=1079257 RepID=UPI001E8E153F|nr:uncharacterized protein BGZ61DRAFT_440936 [Ilyonectria robusta]KAH8735790.1 hypothetical protein BGZ61DRAFT_440936 [Ilyonectria robusta]
MHYCQFALATWLHGWLVIARASQGAATHVVCLYARRRHLWASIARCSPMGDAVGASSTGWACIIETSAVQLPKDE